MSLVRPQQDQRDFYFDSVLDYETEQEKAYQEIAMPVVQDVLDGFNGVVMAYGQTGSGKTHTIFGSRASLEHLYSRKSGSEGLHPECGIVPRCVDHIFDYIKENPNNGQFRITVSFLEIYMEQISDLLLQSNNSSGLNAAGSSPIQQRQSSSHSPIRPSSQGPGGNLLQGSSSSSNALGQNLKLREDPKTGIFVDGLTQVNVKNKEQLHQLIKIGARRRAVNQTAMNKNSSRSHAVLQVFVEQRWVENVGANGQSGDRKDGNHQKTPSQGAQQIKKRHFRKALLTIVDLAGSERLSKTGSEGMRLQEAKTINKSIAALSNCISALSSDKSLNHVPFRDSKLTRLLTESLGGNSKTTICANIGPSLENYDESYSTLLFATRAMSVRTFVKMNEKIEYKMFDEQGRQINGANNVSEKKLLKKNSQLQEQTEELRQEIVQLREQIKKQQSINYTNAQVNPLQSTPLAGGGAPNNFNSNHTHNTSGDTNFAQPWGSQSLRQNMGSRNSYLLSQNSMNRSQSPQLTHFPQPHHNNSASFVPPQFTNGFNGHYPSNFSGVSPQKSAIAYPMQPGYFNLNLGSNPLMMTPQDSQSIYLDPQQQLVSHQQTPTNNSYNQQAFKQSQQLYQQQQKDSALIQKLAQAIDHLQEELIGKTLMIQELREENAKLQKAQGAATNIDNLLKNPQVRQALIERLRQGQI